MNKRDWKKWAYAALIRAVRTFAEAALAYIGTGAVVLGDVNWLARGERPGTGTVRRAAASEIGSRLLFLPLEKSRILRGAGHAEF